jgi:hypothetical protein
MLLERGYTGFNKGIKQINPFCLKRHANEIQQQIFWTGIPALNSVTQNQFSFGCVKAYWKN